MGIALCIGVYILYLSSIYTILGYGAGRTSTWAVALAKGRLASQLGRKLFVDIIISNSSSKPIYEQITSQIKDQIMAGNLVAGEQLPSIRALANSLRVSAITTKRAYADLEAQGFIETVQGKGSFVAGGNDELLREERLREVEGHLLRAIEGARAIGVSVAELVEMMTVLMESDE